MPRNTNPGNPRKTFVWSYKTYVKHAQQTDFLQVLKAQNLLTAQLVSSRNFQILS